MCIRDSVNSDKIKKLHELGYLPIEIWALPEGYKVGMNVPCIEISNTYPEYGLPYGQGGIGR